MRASKPALGDAKMVTGFINENREKWGEERAEKEMIAMQELN